MPGQMPSSYDDELWELVGDVPVEAPAHVVAFVRGLPRVERALDLGCGDGRLTGALRAARVVGADPSAVALERARRRAPDREWVETAPGEALPFADGSFDLALCADTLEHVQDVQGLLSEVRRVLVPGGRLALSTPEHGRRTGLAVLVRGFEPFFDPFSPHLRFFTARSLRGALDDLGFEVEQVRRARGSLLATATR